jgi:hypothetical protein
MIIMMPSTAGSTCSYVTNPDSGTGAENLQAAAVMLRRGVPVGGTALEWVAVMMAGNQTGLGSGPVRARRNYRSWIMQCPQCGVETPDEEWNCVSCRMNVYWASQHYEDLVGIRQQQGLPVAPDTPPFLIGAHASAMDERAERGGKVEHKVRQIARRAMRREASAPVAAQVKAATRSREGIEPGWKRPGLRPASAAHDRVTQQPKEAT